VRVPLDAVSDCGTPFTHVEPTEGVTAAGVGARVGEGVDGDKGAGVEAAVVATIARTVLPPNEVIGDAANVRARAAPFTPLLEMVTVMTTLPALTVAVTALAGMPSLVAMSMVTAEIARIVYWSTVPSRVMRS